jgi:hypothetical protein
LSKMKPTSEEGTSLLWFSTSLPVSVLELLLHFKCTKLWWLQQLMTFAN